MGEPSLPRWRPASHPRGGCRSRGEPRLPAPVLRSAPPGQPSNGSILFSRKARHLAHARGRGGRRAALVSRKFLAGHSRGSSGPGPVAGQRCAWWRSVPVRSPQAAAVYPVVYVIEATGAASNGYTVMIQRLSQPTRGSVSTFSGGRREGVARAPRGGGPSGSRLLSGSSGPGSGRLPGASRPLPFSRLLAWARRGHHRRRT